MLQDQNTAGPGQTTGQTGLLDAANPPRVPVAIVGAGPVGMTLGLALARYGIRSLILDDDDKLSVGSRAICIQRHTLEIFDRLDVARPMVEKGITWTLGRVFYRQKELFQIRFPGGSRQKFPPFINLQQFYTEQYLVDRLKQTDLCEIRWRHAVVDLQQNRDYVTLMVHTPEGNRTIEAAYALAADGAKSPVRHLLKIPFLGKTYNDRFLIADIQAQLDYPNERWFWFDPVFNRGKSALVHPQPDNVWRIDWQLGPDVDIEAARQPAALDRRIREVVGDRPYEIVWASVYTFHQRRAARFRQGRVFLVGDAAHLMSPFGARGMNSGVQDAANLAWKLWLVMSGRAGDKLLDTYDAERREAAIENLTITDKTMAFITPHSRSRLLLRNAILLASDRIRQARKLVNSGRLSQPCAYRHSPIISGRLHLPEPARLVKDRRLLQAAWNFVRGPRAGVLAPDGFVGRAGPAGGQTRLLDLFGHDFVVLYFSNRPDEAALTLGRAMQSAPDLPLKAYVIGEQTGQGLDTGDTAIELLDDPEGEVTRTYAARPGTLYLVRPDGHIAARGLEYPLEQLALDLRMAAGLDLPSGSPVGQAAGS